MNLGWKRKKNTDLWELLDIQVKRHNVNFIWVKGHEDNEYNNRCDKLAVSYYK